MFTNHYTENKTLTHREKEVLHWLALGKTAEMTAQILDIKQRTVKAHIVNIKQKINCYTLFQLGCYYAKVLM
jgi:DNA-binding CsgD family transcriptional regulator